MRRDRRGPLVLRAMLDDVFKFRESAGPTQTWKFLPAEREGAVMNAKLKRLGERTVSRPFQPRDRHSGPAPPLQGNAK